VVDVDPIGVITNNGDGCTGVSKNPGRNTRRCPVGTIEHHVQTGEVSIQACQQMHHIAIFCVSKTNDATDPCTGRGKRRLLHRPQAATVDLMLVGCIPVRHRRQTLLQLLRRTQFLLRFSFPHLPLLILRHQSAENPRRQAEEQENCHVLLFPIEKEGFQMTATRSF